MYNYILKLDIKYEYKFFGEGCDEILPDHEEQEYEYEQITIDRANNKLTIINKNWRGIIKKEYFSTIAGEELEELGDIIKEDFSQKQIEMLLECESLQELDQALKKTPYKEISSVSKAENIMTYTGNYLYNFYRKQLRFSQSPSVVMLSFLYLCKRQFVAFWNIIINFVSYFHIIFYFV